MYAKIEKLALDDNDCRITVGFPIQSYIVHEKIDSQEKTIFLYKKEKVCEEYTIPTNEKSRQPSDAIAVYIMNENGKTIDSF